jgi:hypothetical protein
VEKVENKEEHIKEIRDTIASLKLQDFSHIKGLKKIIGIDISGGGNSKQVA